MLSSSRGSYSFSISRLSIAWRKHKDKDICLTGYLPRTDMLISNLIYPYQNCACAFPPYGVDLKAQLKLGVRDLSYKLQLRNAYIYELAKIMTRTLYIWDITFHLHFKCSCVTVASIGSGYIKLHATDCTCHQLLQQNCGKTF